MNVLKMVRFFYIIYTTYALLLVGTTTINFFQILLSVFLMWINYLMFRQGYGQTRVHSTPMTIVVNTSLGWLGRRSRSTLFVLAVLSIIFSILAVNYYTGQTPISAIQNVRQHTSLYHEYQVFFKEHQMQIFTLKKMPYILMLFYVKLMTFYSYVTFLVSAHKTTLFVRLYLVIITSSSAYIGLSRGTNSEFFELVMIIIFCLLSNQRKGFAVSMKQILTIGALLSLMIYIFYAVVGLRGVTFDDFREPYDPHGILPTLSSSLTYVVMMLYSYFGFGFFYISTYISEVWFSSMEHFVAGLVPYGHVAIEGVSVTQRMTKLADVGVKWHPDTARMIDYFGYLGLLVFCYLLGRFGRRIKKSQDRPVDRLGGFLILMQMMSFPVGQFISTSSASKLISLLVLVYYVREMVLPKKN